MIEYYRHTLPNGMRILVHNAPFAPIATFNLLYEVGARNEVPTRTGFAHLFEHLMFGGSVNVPDFDFHVQRVGGESNAFTTNDYTNYHITLPADNIETAFWLDSDRLLSPSFSQEGLDIQKNVVVEEFRQRYLNKPYGNTYHILRDLAYKVHPYRWPTIGLEPQHVLDASLSEVKEFFFSHYIPRHAVLAVAGNVSPDNIFRMAEKWFGPIERDASDVVPPEEPEQTEARFADVSADVPVDKVYIAFHMGGRLSDDYKLGDLATDILADGTSSRLVQHLVKGKMSCANVNSHITGSLDPGMLIFSAEAVSGVEPETIIDQLWEEIETLKNTPPSNYEITKARNRLEASQTIAESVIQTKAQNLAYFEMLGDASLINTAIDAYNDISAEDISAFMRRICTRNNSSTLIYRHKK